MENSKIILAKKELELLKKHIGHLNLSDYNKTQLLSELNSAQVVNDENLPSDIVCLDSEVEIQEIESNQIFNFHLVMPANADMRKKKISVFAPIGTALLGYRVGSVVKWEMPNGLKTFKILDVRRRSLVNSSESVSAGAV